MPSLGNHDCIDGLGEDLYLGLFGLPRNGSKADLPEATYYFNYGNALFVVLNSMGDVAAQRPWLEKVLEESTATWKFAIFHFPPYAPDEDYPDIRAEWCPLFDKYHVDFVLSGHVHYYLRSKPLYAGKPVASPAEGTIYLVSVAVNDPMLQVKKPDYAAVASFVGDPLYQRFSIDGNHLVSTCYDTAGAVRDQITIDKPAK
jgi:hypothetical protein